MPGPSIIPYERHKIIRTLAEAVAEELGAVAIALKTEMALRKIATADSEANRSRISVVPDSVVPGLTPSKGNEKS